MTIKVDTSDDLGYDYEDFGLDIEGLQAKYLFGEHPTYTVAEWRVIENTEANTYSGYWDYVSAMITEDDINF